MNSEFPNYLKSLVADFETDLSEALAREHLLLSDSAISNASKWFAARVTYLSQRALIAAFHRWREELGLEASDESTVAHERFDLLLLSEDNRKSLVDAQFPKLTGLLAHAYANSLEFVVQVIRDFENDKAHLGGLGISEADHIRTLRFHDEETHNRGRTTVIIDTGGFLVVYKPRSGNGEILIDQVCRLLGAGPFELVAPTVDAGGHCWQKYITSATELNVNVDMEEYMKAAGTLLAACHILGTTDLHADNVFCSVDGKPVIIDGETAIQFRIPDELPADAVDILTSGLVPSTLAENSFWRYFSGLFIESERDSPSYTTFDVVNGGRDSVAFRRMSKPHLKAMPPRGLQDIDLGEAFSILIDSFNRARDIAQSPAMVDLLKSAEEAHVWRQVIRGTGIYSSILDATLMPDALAGISNPADLLEPGPRGTTGANVSVQEKAQITVGDVPYFLLDSSGNVYDGQMRQCGRVRFSERLSLPTKRLVDFVSEDGSAYGEVLKANAQALGAQADAPVSRPIGLHDVLDEVTAFRTNVGQSVDSRWLASDVQEEGVFLNSFSPSFLMGEGTDWLLHQQLAGDTRSPIDRWTEQVRKVPEAFANFEGFGPGTALLVTHGSRQPSDVEAERIHLAVEALASILDKDAAIVDYIGGVESAVAALGNLNILLELGTAERLVRSAQEFLRPRVQNALVGESFGLGHGASGTLLAVHGLIRFAEAHGLHADDQIRQDKEQLASAVASAADNLAANGEIPNRLAWCNGLGGMVGALTITGHLAADDDLVQIFVDQAFFELAEALNKAEALDVSHCHGVAGTLATLRLLADYELVGSETAFQFQDAVVNALNELEVFCGYPGNIYDVGYLNGLGGLIHALGWIEQAPALQPLFAGY